MSQQRTSRAEFTRKAGTPDDLAATDEVRSAGTYPSSAAGNTPDKRVGLISTVEPRVTCPESRLYRQVDSLTSSVTRQRQGQNHARLLLNFLLTSSR